MTAPRRRSCSSGWSRMRSSCDAVGGGGVCATGKRRCRQAYAQVIAVCALCPFAHVRSNNDNVYQAPDLCGVHHRATPTHHKVQGDPEGVTTVASGTSIGYRPAAPSSNPSQSEGHRPPGGCASRSHNSTMTDSTGKQLCLFARPLATAATAAAQQQMCSGDACNAHWGFLKAGSLTSRPVAAIVLFCR